MSLPAWGDGRIVGQLKHASLVQMFWNSNIKQMNVPTNVEFDTTLRYVDALPTQNVSSYVALAVRLGRRPTKHLELAVVGQHLFDNQRLKFSPTLPTEIQRAIYEKVTWCY